MNTGRPLRRHPHQGFSLLELLFVILAILILMGLLLPAVQQAREAGRRGMCSQRLQQLSAAIHSFESDQRKLPSAWLPIASGNEGWSLHSQVLPYLEQSNLYHALDFGKTWNGLQISYPSNPSLVIPLQSLSIPNFHCPSYQLRSKTEVCYAVNRGTWTMWDPATKYGGDGAFVAGPSNVSLDNIRDGLSQTLALAEVLPGGYTQNPFAKVPMRPLKPMQLISKLGGNWTSGGHAEWMNGRAIETGFTAPSSYAEKMDWINVGEGNKTIAYAIVFSSSLHSGGFNATFLDGSVRFIGRTSEEILQAQATRDGGELESIYVD